MIAQKKQELSRIRQEKHEWRMSEFKRQKHEKLVRWQLRYWNFLIFIPYQHRNLERRQQKRKQQSDANIEMLKALEDDKELWEVSIGGCVTGVSIELSVRSNCTGISQ